MFSSISFRYSLLVILFLSAVLPLSAQEIIPPQPYGGEAGLNRFIHEELQYPRQALRDGIEGTVILLFVVDKTGKPINVRVRQSVREDLDQETLRLFRKVLWKPAYIGTINLAREKTFKVRFNIRKYRRICKKRGYIDLPLPHFPVDSTATVFLLDDLDESPSMLFADSSYSFHQFLFDNLRYPESAFRANIEGTVIISFVVEPDGITSNFNIEKHIGGGCSTEAIRLLRLLEWHPGIRDGVAVRTQLKFAIQFRLPNNQTPRNQGTDG